VSSGGGEAGRFRFRFRFHSAFLRPLVCLVAFVVAIFRQVPKPRFLTVVSVRAGDLEL